MRSPSPRTAPAQYSLGGVSTTEPFPSPAPELRAAMETAAAAAAAGRPYKAALEGLLLDLDADTADVLMLAIREGRGAWLPLLLDQDRDAHAPRGRALFLGEAVSGTVTALAHLGWDVVVVDERAERLRFARARDREYTPGRVHHVQSGRGSGLPFGDGSFDLVVQEGGPPFPDAGWDRRFGELARLARDQLAVTADNRLAYKRSTGRRGTHHVPRPLEWLRGALRPRRSERTLAGYRRLFRGFAPARAYALYPHAREFSHVVALDAPAPRLTIGPQERRNVLKLTAWKAGLFPVLTPSFAILGARRDSPPRRSILERVLEELAVHVGEPTPALDVVLGTRSNDCVVHTAPVHAPGTRNGADGTEAGRWTLHLPLCAPKQRLIATHHRFLVDLRERFPAVPVPEPLFAGRAGGPWLTCERRLPGLTAPQITGDLPATARMFRAVARDFARLVVEPDALLDEERFETLVAERFRTVRRLCAVPGTERRLDRMLARARELLAHRRLPLVLYHADLRGKHVQVSPAGDVLGYLDWGASEPVFLPYVDVLHLVAHQRQQEEGCRPERTWELVRTRAGMRPHEREALEEYRDRLGLPDEVCRAIEELYPVFVAAMAERNWDYSRPRWVHSQFGL